MTCAKNDPIKTMQIFMLASAKNVFIVHGMYCIVRAIYCKISAENLPNYITLAAALTSSKLSNFKGRGREEKKSHPNFLIYKQRS